MALISPTPSPSSLALSLSCTAGFRATECPPFLRSNIQKDWNWRGNGKKSRHGFPSMASQSLSFETIPPFSSNAFLEVAKLAREKLKEEVSLRVKDEDISIAKGISYEEIVSHLPTMSANQGAEGENGPQLYKSYCKALFLGNNLGPTVRWVRQLFDLLYDPHAQILKRTCTDIESAAQILKQIEQMTNPSDPNYSPISWALLYVAIEDEAILAFNGDEDACSFTEERSNQSTIHLDEVCIGGKSMSGWLSEFDVLTKEVEAELVQREIGCHVVQVIEAVNTVLFESRHFLRFPVLVDSRFSYLHHVLSSNCGTAIMLSVVYMEICQRLGVSIVGSPLGEDFLIWPCTQTPEELFKVSSGHSLLAVINGGCVEDPRSRASDLNSQSLQGLYVANNRDIIGIALANLIRLHWKRASKGNHGLMLISPLRSINSKDPLLRPVELTLAIMAAERMLLLQPDNWTLRRDYGLLLYYARRYDEAAQELSICMAFAPVEEVEVIEPFVQKLHLLRQIYSLDLEPRHLASS